MQSFDNTKDYEAEFDIVLEYRLNGTVPIDADALNKDYEAAVFEAASERLETDFETDWMFHHLSGRLGALRSSNLIKCSIEEA